MSLAFVTAAMRTVSVPAAILATAAVRAFASATCHRDGSFGAAST